MAADRMINFPSKNRYMVRKPVPLKTSEYLLTNCSVTKLSLGTTLTRIRLSAVPSEICSVRLLDNILKPYLVLRHPGLKGLFVHVYS